MQVGFGWHNAEYRKSMNQRWGKPYIHYGADYWGEHVIWSVGKGVVFDAGVDSTFGGTVIVLYPDCYNHAAKEVMTLVARYKHLASIMVKKGQEIDTSVQIGIMGHTGKFAGSLDHLHFEISTDYEHPNVEYGIYSTNMLISGRKDTTINPADVLHTKVSAPDRQSVITARNYNYTIGAPKSDWTFPIIK